MNNKTHSVTWSLVALTALAPLIWGSTYIVASEVLPEGRPLLAAALRVLPAGLLLLLFYRHWPARGEWRKLLVLSALNIGLFQALLFVAADRLPGGLAAVLGAIQPMVVLLLGSLMGDQSPLIRSWASAFAGFVGMAVMLLQPDAFGAGRLDVFGVAAALGGAACMATGTWLGSQWKLKMPLMTLTGWQLTLGGAMLAPVALVIDPPLPSLSAAEALGYVYLSLIGAMLAYALWFKGVNQLPPAAVAALGLLSPVSALFLGWVFLDQSVSGWGLVGLFAVLGSVLFLQWSATLAKPDRQISAS